MYICLCLVVSRTQIEQAIASGAQTVEQVGAMCSAGTDCGKCQRTIMRLLESSKRDIPSSRQTSQLR